MAREQLWKNQVEIEDNEAHVAIVGPGYSQQFAMPINEGLALGTLLTKACSSASKAATGAGTRPGKKAGARRR